MALHRSAWLSYGAERKPPALRPPLAWRIRGVTLRSQALVIGQPATTVGHVALLSLGTGATLTSHYTAPVITPAAAAAALNHRVSEAPTTSLRSGCNRRGALCSGSCRCRVERAGARVNDLLPRCTVNSITACGDAVDVDWTISRSGKSLLRMLYALPSALESPN